MEMEMIHQGLIPGVQHRYQAYLASEIRPPKLKQSLRHGFEQQAA
jgi:hypothetical protein